MNHYDVVIVGGGHAGAQAAVALRQLQFPGSIAIVTNESEFPYERPPLSKDYLAGDKPFERLLIRQPSFWSERAIDFIFDSQVATVDPERHSIGCANGESIGYDKLIWAAGGTPRRLTLPGADLSGITAIRTRADVDAISAQLSDVHAIAIVGGGYIGLEAAAIFTKFDKKIILLEAMPRLLARVAGEEISEFIAAEHAARGVDIRLDARITGLYGDQKDKSTKVRGLALDDGETVTADLVVVGIGIDPNIEPLLDAGAHSALNGIRVDPYCRTTLPDIFAIGDCAAHDNDFAGGLTVRIESVQNANDQASTAARALTGNLQPYRSVPWFWSNQYDIKLQTVGLSLGYDQTVLRGDPAARSFSVVYLKEGRVIALDCVNAVRDYAQGRKLVEAGANPDTAMLADPAVALKDMV